MAEPKSGWRIIESVAVLRSWAVAEATSKKEDFSAAIAQHLPEVRPKLLRGEELSEGELNKLVRGLQQYRAPLITGLLALQPAWYEGALPVEDLAGMRFFNLPPWTAKWPSRIFGDLAGMRSITGSEPEFLGFQTSIERPIAVAPCLDGPFCLVEGYTRCASILRDHRAGLSTMREVPMIVGVTPRVSEWSNGQGWVWW